MTRPDTWLLEHRSDTYSQCGEDGVILKIIEMLPESDRWCVEFGAWDGKVLSNTRNLIENHGFSAVLIEADPLKFDDLSSHYSGRENVITLKKRVGFNPDDGLDSILSSTPIGKDFDFLSIDIDGNDFHVWKAIEKYQPKIVCIEFNPTIPTEVEFVQEAHPEVAQGSSLLSLAELGRKKGYELVSVLPFNAVFVRAGYFPLFQIEDNSPRALRTDFQYVTHFFTGYDGTSFLRGNLVMPWHHLPYSEARVQHLPKRLRKYPASYTEFEKRFFRLLVKFRRLFRLS